MANNPANPSSWLFRFVLSAAVIMIVGLLSARALNPPEPPVLAETDVVPKDAKRFGVTWAWLESVSGKPTRLLIADEGKVKELASPVSSFDSLGDRIVWSTAIQDKWELQQRRGNATSRLNSSGNEPFGIKLVDNQVIWLEKVPGIDSISPLPPLADTTAVWTATASGGSPLKVGSLYESEPGQVLGIRKDDVIFTAYRPGFPGGTAFYAMNLESGVSSRIFGDAGRNPAIMTRAGEVYWASPSRESSEPSVDSCIRTADRSGKYRTIADWLTPGGYMYSSGSRAFYIDGDMNPSVWPAESMPGLPKPIPLPIGFGAAAISDSKILLAKRLKTGRVTLHEVDLP